MYSCGRYWVCDPPPSALHEPLLFAFEEGNPGFLEDLTQVFYECVDALESIPEEDLTALELAFMRAHSTARVVA